MAMRLRSGIAMALLLGLGGLLPGCGSGAHPPPSVRVLQPEAGATLAGKQVTFRAEADVDDNGSTDSLTLRWSFGDGETATGPEVTHTYDDPGSYRVSVVAVTEPDDAGEPTQLTIEVRNAPPTATIQADPTRGTAPLEVVFAANGSSDPDGTIEAYRWHLGDDRAQTGPRVVHTYDEPGDHEARLVVQDANGAEASATTTIQVARDPTARPAGLTWEVRMVTPEEGQALFDPAVLVIEPGDTVRWTLSTGRHSSTAYEAGLPSGAAAWDTGIIDDPGASIEVTFPEDAPTGSYPYRCRVHEDAGMLGLIVVGEPSDLDPTFRQNLPELLRDKLDELMQRAEQRTEGGQR